MKRNNRSNHPNRVSKKGNNQAMYQIHHKVLNYSVSFLKSLTEGKKKENKKSNTSTDL